MCDIRKKFLSCCRLIRRKSGKEKSIRWLPRHTQRRQQSRCTRRRENREASIYRTARQFKPRICHHRCSRIRYACHDLTLPDRRQHLCLDLGATVIVIGDQTALAELYPMDIQQFAGVAGVLGRQHIGLFENIQRTQCDIPRGPNRRGHQIQTRRNFSSAHQLNSHSLRFRR